MSPPQAVPSPTPTPAQVEAGDWEKEFFDKHGITDEDEKKAIRGRARVLAYDRARQKSEEKESQPPAKKPWYKD